MIRPRQFSEAEIRERRATRELERYYRLHPNAVPYKEPERIEVSRAPDVTPSDLRRRARMARRNPTCAFGATDVE